MYLDDKQMEEVKPDMTAREIRRIRTPDPEPEEIEEQIPEQVSGQMCMRPTAEDLQGLFEEDEENAEAEEETGEV